MEESHSIYLQADLLSKFKKVVVIELSTIARKKKGVVSGTTLLESYRKREQKYKNGKINSSLRQKEFKNAQQKEESFSAFLSSKRDS